MANLLAIGGSGQLFAGEDKSFVFEVLNRSGVPVDTTGYTFSLVISASAVTAALLTLSGSVSGSYTAVRATNAQRVTFTMTDAQSAVFLASDYHFSVKRTDNDAETIIAYGKITFERTNQV